MTVTDDIKAQLDIVDFIDHYVPLKKSGRNYKALCPFHAENTPSFVVFPDSQNWRCFGACSEGGDIFTFLMKIEGWDFPEALRVLAERAGVELQPQSPEQQEAQDYRERLRELLADTAAFYVRLLNTAPEADFARQYVEERGIAPDTVETFQLGYAPDSWDATMNMLLEKGYSRDELVDAGLLVVRDDGRVYDRFRDRLMIPIRDPRGRVVGFGARALSPDAVPKYLNSPQGEVFDKSRLLYGLSDARRTIRETETAIIVEGYMDVIQAHQAGFTNVVAEMGTALTEDQLSLLARYANRLILALDPDAAGQMATERGREVIERVSRAAAEQIEEEGVWDFDTAEREYKAKLTTEFDARGMLHYESRMGFDIRVIILPEGYDPDDLIREHPDHWAEMVESAIPIVEYVIQRTTEGVDLDDPKVKSQIAAEIIPLIEDVADPVERSHYVQRLTRLLKVPESTLFPERGAGQTPRRRARPTPPAGAAPQSAQRLARAFTEAPTRSREAFCLAALVRYPRLLYRINRILAEFLAPEHLAGSVPDELLPESEPPLESLAWRVTPGDFAHPEYQSIFSAWQVALTQEHMDAIDYLLDTADAIVKEHIVYWNSVPLYSLLRGIDVPQTELTDDKIFEEVLRGILELRIKRLDEHFQSLTFLLEDEANGGNTLSAEQHRETLQWLFAARLRIAKALQKYGMLGRRLDDANQHVKQQLRTS